MDLNCVFTINWNHDYLFFRKWILSFCLSDSLSNTVSMSLSQTSFLSFSLSFSVQLFSFTPPLFFSLKSFSFQSKILTIINWCRNKKTLILLIIKNSFTIVQHLLIVPKFSFNITKENVLLTIFFFVLLLYAFLILF